MENEVVNTLANEIIEKLSGKLNIENEMREFLLSDISKENKEKVLEQLYLFQLYSNAYVGPDPKGKIYLFSNAKLVLTSKSDEELITRMEELKQAVELLKNAELNPLSTIKAKLEDKEKYKNVKF